MSGLSKRMRKPGVQANVGETLQWSCTLEMADLHFESFL